MRVVVVLAGLLLVAFAGCVESQPADEGLNAEVGDLLALTPASTASFSSWNGEQMVPGPVAAESLRVDVGQGLIVPRGPTGLCVEGCRRDIVVEAPPGLDGWLEARIAWDGTVSPGVQLRLNGPGEARVERGFDMARYQLWAPQAGTYTLHIEGPGEFWGWVRLFDRDGPRLPGSDRLPNLVTLAPNEIGVDGCLPEEQAEQQAERCLRLGNAVANMGDGPLEVHLDYPNGVLSAGGVGRFVQRVYGDDGFRDVSAGPAQFHLTHSHFHYYGLAEFRLYEHDLDTGLRGREVGGHMKQGFCFLDWGPMDDPEVTPEDEEHAQQNCLIPDLIQGWSMGISVGWYDFYWAGLADQYVDISGVPDGVYELVSIADGGDTLLESDERDNAASAIIRLSGDSVDVLEKRAFYDNPEG